MMGAHGYVGDFTFIFSKFDYFLQQKLVIIVLELQLSIGGFVKGWG
jgi:hypothetical protein